MAQQSWTSFDKYVTQIEHFGEDRSYALIPKPRKLEDWRDPKRRAAIIDRHLEFRASAIAWADRAGKTGKTLIRELCKRDVLTYWNCFYWTYDPRNTRTPAIPFVTWPFQDAAARKMNMLMESGEDGVIIKSRDMGASWMLLALYEWRWHFYPMQSFMLASRKEDLVDKSSNPDSLFWKVDFAHKWQPRWLMPDVNRMKLHIGNEWNGSTIDGESTTGDLGRAGRRTSVGLDEFAAVDHDDGYNVLAATQSVSDCRFFNSTPQGMGNAYADLAHKEGVQTIVFHWKDHPIKSMGLYTSELSPGGTRRLKILDESYEFPSDYPFILDDKEYRSPWYDAECARTPIPSHIAQELDMDFLGSGALFFDRTVIQLLQAESAVPPYWCGELDYDTTTMENGTFRESEGGRLRLWLHPDEHGKARPGKTYVVACDVAEGTGASSSTMSVVCKETGEKVAEMSENSLRPDEWANMAVAVAKWLGGAKLIWESNGPGRSFGSAVIDMRYNPLYYRESETSVTRRSSDIPGWASTKETKKQLLGEYLAALARHHFVNRSTEALAECLEYIHDKGGVSHSKALRSHDPSATGENHGDMVIADALAWRGIRDAVREDPEPTEADPPVGSFAWRRLEYQRAKEQEASW